MEKLQRKFYMTKSTADMLRIQAAKRDESQSEIVEKAVLAYLKGGDDVNSSYRAAVWISDDGQAELRLTDRDQAHLPDEELIAEARKELAREGGTEDGGRIVITEWSD